MAFIGNNPKVVTSLYLEPQSADPADPREGDIFYSNGTPRAEGPWVYQNGAWAQFSTGAAINILDDLTLTPQNADPGSPSEGMIFYADGTSRAQGIWFYNGSDWVQATGLKYQEFTHKTRFKVRAASTANVTLASGVENGDSFGGVTLATNDTVLLKNQSVASENGVYVVAASGAPSRHTSYDSADELTYAQILVTEGTNANNLYWQTAVLTSLSDNQTWGTSAPTFTFTVPEDIYELNILACGGGGGGGRGGSTGLNSSNSTSGGGGGQGSIPQNVSVVVTPGDTLTITLGVGGKGAAAGTSTSSTISGAAGSDGTATTITGTGVVLSFAGGLGGNAGAVAVSGGTASTAASQTGTWAALGSTTTGGGTTSAAPSATPSQSTSGGASSYYSTAAAGGTGESALQGGGRYSSASGGGGGGAGYGAGGSGSNGGVFTANYSQPGGDGGYGAGGGGSGGACNANLSGSYAGAGGQGGSGYVRISW